MDRDAISCPIIYTLCAYIDIWNFVIQKGICHFGYQRSLIYRVALINDVYMNITVKCLQNIFLGKIMIKSMMVVITIFFHKIPLAIS